MAPSTFSFIRSSAFLMVGLICSFTVGAQVTIESFQKTLIGRAEFSEADLAALRSGDPVIRTLKNQDKKDFGVCGVIRIQSTKDFTMAAFRESMSRRADKSIMAQGDFRSSPTSVDLSQLTLDAADIEAMKECEVGDCKLKLSAAMIKRIRSEIDWNAADKEERANQLFREMLGGYVADYAASGESALMQYDNQRKSINLADEHRSLLERSLFVNEIAPEFAKYLTDFPRSQLTGVDNNLHWTKIGFGLEPLVAVTHSAMYTRADGLFIATRQIYASRFVESSLALSMLITVNTGGAAERYLIFTDLSRSDSLGGLLGGLKRSIVGADVIERTKEILKHAKGHLDRPDASPPEIEPTIMERLRDVIRDRLILVLIVVVGGVALLYLLLGRRRS